MNRGKRCAAGVLALVCLCAALCRMAAPARAEEPPKPPVVRDENGLAAAQAVVYDTASEEILFEKTVRTGKVCPASVTKLFTALVALLYLDPQTQVTAGEELDFVAEDSSMAFIYRDQTVTVSMLVEGMLLPSGNDAAYILATAAGRKIAEDQSLQPGEAVTVFVKEMNVAARAMGLTHTHFMNPDGYHMGSHFSSVEDLVKIAQAALENPVISRYAGTLRDDVTYVSGETNTWENTNALLDPESPYYREDACGLKTGSTDEGGNCLLSAFRKEDGYLIVGVFGCPYTENRFEDTLLLADRYG